MSPCKIPFIIFSSTCRPSVNIFVWLRGPNLPLSPLFSKLDRLIRKKTHLDQIIYMVQGYCNWWLLPGVILACVDVHVFFPKTVNDFMAAAAKERRFIPDLMLKLPDNTSLWRINHYFPTFCQIFSSGLSSMLFYFHNCVQSMPWRDSQEPLVVKIHIQPPTIKKQDF